MFDSELSSFAPSFYTDAQLNNFQQIFDTCCTEIASSQELDLTPQDVSGMLF